MTWLIRPLVGGIILIAFVIFVVAYLTWLERKVAGRMQRRIGPYWVGVPHGWLQPIADTFKLLQKEDIVPKKVDKWVFNAAPIVAMTAGLLVFVTIPFSKNLVISDLNIGILFILAISSLVIIAIFMAGWGSNNKYALLSAMRFGCQLMSYEVPLVLASLVPILLAGSMKLSRIVEAQNPVWFIAWPLVGQVSFVLFLLSSLAELNRIPFDIPEAESELVAGFTIEYSGIKFALFYLVEYAHFFAVSAIGTVLFLGGWKGPLLPPLFWFLLKCFLLLLLILWIRWSFIRLRVDQLMRLNWKVLVPLALLNLFLAGIFVIAGFSPKGVM